MSETPAAPAVPDGLPEPRVDEAGREIVELDPVDVLRVEARTWRRRYDAEAARVESIEAAFEGARRQAAGLRQMVADRDAEIEELRRQLDAAEPKAD